MPAVDIAPLMDSLRWKDLKEPARAELKNLWQHKDTSDEDRAIMLQKMQTPRAASPVEAPAPVTTAAGAFPGAGIEPIQPGGVQRALESRTPFKPMGTVPPTDVALPFQRPDVLPSQREAPLEEKTFVGESDIGEIAGTLLVPGPLKPVAGALGAGAGEGLRQWREGEKADWRKMANEALWSAVPEFAESGIRYGVKQFARNTPGGIILRHGKAAEEARQVPGKVFQPKPADQISDAFEEVRRSGLNIDTDDITRHLTTLSPGKQADTLNILTNLDREHRTGGRYAQLYQDLISGQGMAGSSIGDLQTMRSHLRQRAEQLRNGSPEARQLVQDLQGAVDDAIDFGLTSGAMQASTPQIRDTLHTARRDWANRTAADDMSELLEGKISSTPDLSENKFRLSTFVDEIRRGRSEATKSINRSLDMTPGARDRFNSEMKEISRLFETVEFSIASDVGGISRFPLVAAVRQGIGQVLLTERGRKWFGDAVTEGRGKLSPNSVAYLVNVARGVFAPELAENFPIRPARSDQESRRAPGGPARSTD